MLSVESLISLKYARGGSNNTTELRMRSKEEVVSECRLYIQKYTKNLKISGDKRREQTRLLINKYVNEKNPLVEELCNEDKQPNSTKVIDFLIDAITNYGILTKALEDDDVSEIRCNGRFVKIERNSKIEDLKLDGKLAYFKTPQEQDIVLRKLLGLNVRVTQKYAIANARTLEGYRVAAVHYTCVALDINNPENSGYHAIVIRKVKQSRLTISDLVRNGMLSDDMAKLATDVVASGLTFGTYGPTGGGKTTFNNAVLKMLPKEMRIYSVQNPTEMDLTIKDSSGRVTNDIVQLEPTSISGDSAFDYEATMLNLLIQSLRMTPDILVIGEIRTNKETKQAVELGLAGHPISVTGHGPSGEGALTRIQTGYLAESGNEPSHLALKKITDVFKYFFIIKQLMDGTRKVVEICEVRGISEKDKDVADVQIIYEYEPTGYDRDVDGTVKKVYGVHKRVGKISEQSVKAFKYACLDKDKYLFLAENIEETCVETYSGSF